jgi:hypothetical protein
VLSNLSFTLLRSQFSVRVQVRLGPVRANKNAFDACAVCIRTRNAANRDTDRDIISPQSKEF